MIFETERLILRPWDESDAESLFKYASSPDVGPAAGWPVHESVSDSLEIIRSVLSVSGTFAVCLKDDNKAVGSIGLISPAQSHFSVGDDELEIGYWIGVPFWGQGLIPEAVEEMLHRGFVDLGLEAVWCGYFDGNLKSRRVQEKCGFLYRYTRENVPVPTLGGVRAEHISCLTKEQWLTR